MVVSDFSGKIILHFALEKSKKVESHRKLILNIGMSEYIGQPKGRPGYLIEALTFVGIQNICKTKNIVVVSVGIYAFEDYLQSNIIIIEATFKSN